MVFVDVQNKSDKPRWLASKPFKSIQKAIKIAKVAHKHIVLVSTGEYKEAFTVEDGISIYGGYSASKGWKRMGTFPKFLERSIQTDLVWALPEKTC